LDRNVKTAGLRGTSEVASGEILRLPTIVAALSLNVAVGMGPVGSVSSWSTASGAGPMSPDLAC
jgi:hypothetical protein